MKKIKLTITQATKEDLEPIVQFNIDEVVELRGMSMDHDFVTDGVKAVIDDPAKGFYLLAKSEEIIIGQLLVTKKWADKRNGYFLWIQSVYVAPAYRKLGVFHALYNYVLDIARNNNDVGIRLNVDRSNDKARAVFKSVGMQLREYLIYEEKCNFIKIAKDNRI